MKVRLGNLVGVLGSLLVFVGTLGVASPMCVGWFYSPKLPGELNQNKCEYKKISLKEYSNNVKKQISFLLCFIVVFSFVSVAFAQNQFYVSDEKLLEQNKGLRSEIESQINNNLKKSNMNYSEEYNREVTLDLIGDIDTIRKSYQQPVKVYSEIIIGEDDSRLDSHLNVGNQAILSTNTKNESWISSGRPIICYLIKGMETTKSRFSYEGFMTINYALILLDQFTHLMGLHELMFSQRKEMLETFLKIIAETIILLGGWRIGLAVLLAIYTLPIFILFYLVPWGIVHQILLYNYYGET